MPKRTIVILLGPPGSGKGSQATLLKTQLHLPHLSTGDLLREHVAHQSQLGKIAKSYIDHGKLVPDAIILDMIMERINQPDCHKGFLLDGFPRTLVQAQELQKKLSSDDLIFVLSFELDDQIIVERITGRLICSKCMAPYHKKFSPSKKENICDACGGELYQRADDTEAVIKNRLNVYHQQTAPLIAYYQTYPHFHKISADDHKDEIFKKIVNLLKVKG